MGLFNFLFSKMARKAFNRVDYNNDGQLQPSEVELAVLQLYNIVNKRLPGWQDPPSHTQIMAAMKEFDTNNDGVLNPEEFERFARQLLNTGPDQFFSRVGRDAFVKSAVLPALSMGVKRGLQAVPGLEGAGGVPHMVLAPLIGCVVKAVTALLPVN